MNKIYLVERSSSGVKINEDGVVSEFCSESIGIDYSYIVEEDAIVVLCGVEYKCNEGDVFLKMYPKYTDGKRGLPYGIVVKSKELYDRMKSSKDEYLLKSSGLSEDNDSICESCANC